jgi:hypothetical protein
LVVSTIVARVGRFILDIFRLCATGPEKLQQILDDKITIAKCHYPLHYPTT